MMVIFLTRVVDGLSVSVSDREDGVAIVLGAVLLDEKITWAILAGGALILAGVVL